jgi:hypothetical protein
LKFLLLPEKKIYFQQKELSLKEREVFIADAYLIYFKWCYVGGTTVKLIINESNGNQILFRRLIANIFYFSYHIVLRRFSIE